MTTPTPSNPLVDLLAGWEDKNGTMAAIMPHEWAELMRPVMNACMYQSPRQIRSDLAARDAELAAMRAQLPPEDSELPSWQEAAIAWKRKAEEAARDKAVLLKLIDAVIAIPNLTDEQLDELQRNCKAAIIARRGA